MYLLPSLKKSTYLIGFPRNQSYKATKRIGRKRGGKNKKKKKKEKNRKKERRTLKTVLMKQLPRNNIYYSGKDRPTY